MSNSKLSEANLSALYQEMILDHYRKPRNKGDLENADARADLKNPLCGDEVGVQVIFDGDKISDIKFTGQGCSISQASASMMTELVKGLTKDEAEALRKTFRSMIMGEIDGSEEKSLGRARALSGVSKYPARVKCALLSWNALEAVVYSKDESPSRGSA